MDRKTTKLILIRHGESLGNLDKRFLGHTDLDLSPMGYKQAELIGKYFKDNNIDVDAIYSSDLKRAYNTVLPISKLKNIPIITSEALREIYAGDWESLKFDELDTKYPYEYDIWKNNIGLAHCNNGESVLELQSRVFNKIEDICSKNSGKVVCIGTHATPIRTFYAKCMGLAPEEIKEIPWVVNASLTIFEYKCGAFNLIQNNFCEHLNGLVTYFPKNV